MTNLPQVGDFWAPDEHTAPRVVLAVLSWDGGWRVLFEDGGDAVDLPDDSDAGPTPAEQLAEAQALAAARVAFVRDRVIAAGADTPSGRVDTTERSITIIQGLVQLATIAIAGGSAFEQPFRLADNTMVTVDGPAMVQIGVGVSVKIGAAYARSWELKAEIEAATTIPAVDAIDLTAGWPA